MNSSPPKNHHHPPHHTHPNFHPPSHDPSHSPPALRRHSRSSTSTSSTTASASSFLTFPLTYSLHGLLRRLSSDDANTTTSNNMAPKPSPSAPRNLSASLPSSAPAPVPRTASPFQPPPLTPLTLLGHSASTPDRAKLLTRALAEEIRLLVPPRLALASTWRLLFGLERDGVSLATLYKKCEAQRGTRGGLVLVVRDAHGGTFGAFLTAAPHPAPHYFGTGESFLWRATALAGIPNLGALPPPPSSDTSKATRMTTIGTEGIRFKAFPYSGVNDYIMFCESDYLSVGGGDGHYGLWLDDNLEKGISETSLTFGNEGLSEQGRSFDVIGVEVWLVGD